MKKILITRKLIKDSEDKASNTFEPIFNSNDELYSQSKVIEMSKGCDGILTSLTDKMDKETINKLPDTIKIISNFAVGFGNIDLEAAKKRGIAVTNTPEVLSDATAEIGVLLILGACRRAAEGIESAREGGWKWSADYLIGKQLTGTRLGILGMGRIGQKIAKIAKSLGMVIHYHNRSKLSEDKEQGAVYHDKQRLVLYLRLTLIDYDNELPFLMISQFLLFFDLFFPFLKFPILFQLIVSQLNNLLTISSHPL